MLDIISKLNKAFQNAYHNPNTSFYRDLYSDRVSSDFKIDSIADWRKLPLLSKDDLQAVPLLERLFTDIKNADALRSSSGTSGNRPLMTLRNFPLSYDAFYKKVTPTGILSFTDSSITEMSVRKDYPDIPFVVGELSSMGVATRLAAGLPINVLTCWLFAVESCVPHLDRFGLRDGIEVVCTYGEKMRPTDYQKIKKFFPKAIIFTIYTSTETHDSRLGNSVDDFDMKEGAIFSISPDVYFELYDEEANKVIEETGKEGEIVVTMLWTENNPSPLLRYKTGDLAKYVEYDQDQSKRRYTVSGRKNIDSLRIPGGVLTDSEFERAFSKTAKNLHSNYELHYRFSHEGSLAQVELWVLPSGPYDKDEFLRNLMKEVTISPRRKYIDAVDEGQIPPITLKEVTRLSREGKKRLRFVIEKD